MKSKVVISLTVPLLAVPLAVALRPAPSSVLTVSGTVSFSGAAEAGEIIDMSSDAFCAQQQATAQVRERSVTTGANGGLQDVIVYVKSGAPQGDAGGGGEPALLDQRGCMYRPGLVVLRTDQPLVIRNSDATLHNVHVYTTVNRGFNIGQPFQGVESRRQFTDAEMGIRVRCDIHGWMSGTIAVFDHDYFAVTDQDGRFTIDLPPGNYQIEAWHAELGTRLQTVTVRAGETPRLTFEF